MKREPRKWDDAFDHKFFSQEEIDESNARVAGIHIEPDKDLVLNALNRCEPYAVPDCCNGCPYQNYADSTDECIAQLHADAHELLAKERTPRILSIAEVRGLKGNPILWLEIAPHKGGHVIYATCFEKVFTYTGMDVMTGETYSFDAVSFVGEGFDRLDEYGKSWRLWTDRPTEKQMKEAMWNDCH